MNGLMDHAVWHQNHFSLRLKSFSNFKVLLISTRWYKNKELEVICNYRQKLYLFILQLKAMDAILVKLSSSS